MGKGVVCYGLGSGTPGRGKREKARASRRGTAPLLGREATCWALGEWMFLGRRQVPGTSVWGKGSGGQSVMWCLLRDLQVAGTDRGGLVGGQREAWPATTGGL